MRGYILLRLLLMIPTLFGLLLITFVIVQFAPGGPIEHVLSQIDRTDVNPTHPIGNPHDAPAH